MRLFQSQVFYDENRSPPPPPHFSLDRESTRMMPVYLSRYRDGRHRLPTPEKVCVLPFPMNCYRPFNCNSNFPYGTIRNAGKVAIILYLCRWNKPTIVPVKGVVIFVLHFLLLVVIMNYPPLSAMLLPSKESLNRKYQLMSI